MVRSGPSDLEGRRLHLARAQKEYAASGFKELGAERVFIHVGKITGVLPTSQVGHQALSGLDCFLVITGKWEMESGARRERIRF
jgi:hypothetical protein